MKEYFTTHDIAVMLNLTRVTIRNWVVKGRLAATATPGGHRRISRAELIRFLEENGYDIRIIKEYELIYQKNFIYCWEYHHGVVHFSGRHNCVDCVVHNARAQKCFILRKVSEQSIWFCSDECGNCGYYRKYFSSD